MRDENDGDHPQLDPLTRRKLLRRVGASSAVFMAAPLLVACGGSDSGSTDGAVKGGADSGVGRRINEVLGIDPAEGGKGKELRLGAVLPLSGSAADYGRAMREAMDLAVDHIRAAGGPDIKITYTDHKSGDPDAGASETRRLGIDRVGAVMGSYLAGFGAMLPGVKKYEMLTLDPGGGTGALFQAQPYFYGMRAITPDDPFAGAYRYVKENKPDAKRVALVAWDAGGPFVNAIKKNLEQALGQHGMELVATETVPIGETNFSGVMSRLQRVKPDVIQHAMWGPDPGYFMRSLGAAGLDGVQVIGSEYTPEAARVGGKPYEESFWFAADSFDFTQPANPWSKLFVEEFQKRYNKLPDLFYSANFYETTFAFWDLARRVLKNGGDINKGPDLLAALEQSPRFQSLYGGDATTVGEVELSTKTHTLTKRQMGLFAIKGGKPKALATFDLNADGYQAASA